MKNILLVLLLLTSSLAYADRSAVKDFFLEVAKGKIPRHSKVSIRGHNDTVGAVFETIWNQGGVYPFPTSALAMTIVSTSILDDGSPAGTGAQTVDVNCLDISYDVIATQTITLDGTTPVAIPTSCFRVNSSIVLAVGSLATNFGTITIENGGTVYGIIEAGDGISRSAFYTVPNNMYISVQTSTLDVDANKSIALKMFLTLEDTGRRIMPFQYHVTSIGQSTPLISSSLIPPKTDIDFRAAITSGSGEVDVNVDMILMDAGAVTSGAFQQVWGGL